MRTTKKGDEVEEDVSCNSAYMMGAIDCVGVVIRKSYHWMSSTQSCYLIMDNAGGHGSKEAITNYVALLLNKHYIIVIFQTPRSSYTNILNLGLWMCLQSAVELQHYLQRCNTSALCNTVYSTWNKGNLDRSQDDNF